MNSPHTSRVALMPLRPLVQALLADHRPDKRGLCTGCLDLGRLVFAPCPHADWARAVDDTLLSPATLELLGLPDQIPASWLDRLDTSLSGRTA